MKVLTLFKSGPGKFSAKDAEDNTKQPLSGFSFSQKVETMDDKIERHSGKTPFQYVSLVQPDSRTFGKILATLGANSIIDSSQPLKSDEIPTLDLLDKEYKIPMSQIFPFFTRIEMDNWINLYELYFRFSGSLPFFAAKGEVLIKLVDERIRGNQMVKESVVNENTLVTNFFSLDYSFHKKDLKWIYFVISCSNSGVKDGFYWGSLSMQIKITHSKEAKIYNTVPAVSLPMIPVSGTANFKYNPDKTNSTFKQSHIDSLRDMRKQGLLMDFSEPQGRQFAIRDFDGSVVGSDNQEVDDEIETDLFKQVPKAKFLPSPKKKSVLQSIGSWAEEQERLRMSHIKEHGPINSPEVPDYEVEDNSSGVLFETRNNSEASLPAELMYETDSEYGRRMRREQETTRNVQIASNIHEKNEKMVSEISSIIPVLKSALKLKDEDENQSKKEETEITVAPKSVTIGSTSSRVPSNVVRS